MSVERMSEFPALPLSKLLKTILKIQHFLYSIEYITGPVLVVCLVFILVVDVCLAPWRSWLFAAQVEREGRTRIPN